MFFFINVSAFNVKMLNFTFINAEVSAFHDDVENTL